MSALRLATCLHFQPVCLAFCLTPFLLTYSFSSDLINFLLFFPLYLICLSFWLYFGNPFIIVINVPIHFRARGLVLSSWNYSRTPCEMTPPPPPIKDHLLLMTVFPLMDFLCCINDPSSTTTRQTRPATTAIWILPLMNDHPKSGF